MSNNFEGLPTNQLRAMMQQCWQTIKLILDRLTDAPEMRAGIQRLMTLATLSELAVKEPDLMRAILQVNF